MSKISLMVKKNVHLVMDEKIIKRLKAIADREGRNTSELIREAVARLIYEREKNNKGYEKKN